MSPPVRLAAVVPYPPGRAPGQRFRLEQWLPEMTRLGVRTDLLPFLDDIGMERLYHPGRLMAKSWSIAAGLARRAALLSRLNGYDVTLVYRAASIVGPATWERLARRVRPLVFDFDDAIFIEHTSAANRPFGWAKFAAKTATLCRLSTEVVVGNEYLARYARKHARRVTVIPSSVDVHRYTPQSRSPNPTVVVGWMGSSTSQQHLEDFFPSLERLAARRSFLLRVVSDRRPEFPAGIRAEWGPWSVDTEVEELRGFDVGIMPMPDDAWSRGKCSMKALLYMAVGVPAVASAVGMNVDVIQDRVNGRLARTDDEWVAALEQLIDDASLRRALGDAGRITVEQSYSTERCAALFVDVVRRAAERTP